MIHLTKNKFVNRINSLHRNIVIENTKINSLMCSTLLDLLNSDEPVNFYSEYKNYPNNIIEIKNKLLECVQDLKDEQQLNILNVTANKVCGTTDYNQHIINKINVNIDFLLNMIKIDINVVKKLTNTNEKYYVDLFKFIKTLEVIKVFKILPNEFKTFLVCKTALDREPDVIKFIDEQTEDICNFAIATGHKKLSDIKMKYMTQSICKQYIEVDIENLKYITASINLPESYFIEIINKNHKNFLLINDDDIKTSGLCTFLVNKDGRFIKYVPSKLQTVRLINIAEKQNKIAKYYVTYDCPKNVDVLELTNLIINSIQEFKTHKIENEYIEEIIKNNNQTSNIKFNNGILIEDKIVNRVQNKNNYEFISNNKNDPYSVIFYVMTQENYLNHQYVKHYETGTCVDINVLIPNNETTKKYGIINNHMNIQNCKFRGVLCKKTEMSVLFIDMNKNKFVSFLEIIQ